MSMNLGSGAASDHSSSSSVLVVVSVCSVAATAHISVIRVGCGVVVVGLMVYQDV